jgi:hypothetical protein
MKDDCLRWISEIESFAFIGLGQLKILRKREKLTSNKTDGKQIRFLFVLQWAKAPIRMHRRSKIMQIS